MEKSSNGQNGTFMRPVGVLENIVNAAAAYILKEKGANRRRFQGVLGYYMSPGDWYNHKSGMFGKNRRKELKRGRRRRNGF